MMTQSSGAINSIKQKAGKGIVRIEADFDTGMAIAALLSSLHSDGSIAILSQPRLDRARFRIDIHGLWMGGEGPNNEL